MRINRPKHSDTLRLILLLDACEAADLTPIPVARFHALAFLANVLAPVWAENSFDGKILKRQAGPFYPEIQRELDRLVGLGLVAVHNVGHVKDRNRWRLDGSFSLEDQRAKDIIEFAEAFEAERATKEFFRRLAFASTRLKQPIEQLVFEDVTWADKRTGTGDVIDFSEWQTANYSASAAQYFDRLSPRGLRLSRGDRLQLYMHLLERRSDASN
ncbi:hypothetical protein [Bradyrhizobium sp. HKCCYLRH3061]|uniref:hypothetical protein n=1 Tax=Bradyrhizobium sp. HKCCYLRH3061 TaxID=3420734 RepID=UPI003EBBCC43